MRFLALLLVFSFALNSQAQGLLRRRLAATRAPASSEAATNEFGRTRAEQRQYEAFSENNPSGKNRFGRTFDEDRRYADSLVVPSFLGFAFGEKMVGERTQVLEKPFRMFGEVSLSSSALGRIDGVSMTQKTKDLSMASISNETVQLIALLENQYRVDFKRGRWEQQWVSEGMSAEFKTTNVEMSVSCSYVKNNGEGELKLVISNVAISKSDRKEKELQELRAVEERQKSVVLSANEGADMIDASKPSAKPKTRESSSSSLLDRRLRRGDTSSDLLEAALTTDEAVKLVKENNPRGYYQLAINISKNRSWTDKTFDAQKNIDYCLSKAAEEGYANAIFLRTLIRDNKLGHSSSYGLLGGRSGNSPTQLMRKYCGFELSSWCSEGSLTNEADVAAIMSVYRDLERKGVKPATEAINGLQERVDNVKSEIAKRKERAVAHDKMADLVRSVVKLPEEKVDKPAGTIEEAAKASGRVYIKTTGSETAKIGWSPTDRKPLTIELYDAGEGFTRELRFSQDGRLIYVSPAE